ncbi:phosphatidylinositol/phosphatidylcholine transfer protein SFH10 [Pyrus x bretschneideri]|uniref:phosphatidylinositol/phosphatidylcholine transfer protein SFH10 n=1 Tax=Pyrus x bretschneideri TaxID=225117 RepID=UPI0020303EF8|nr:phosphatidylinositol/phosphatidylcholine transfer protein SFH10 [Pyrus x bretschneideri]
MGDASRRIPPEANVVMNGKTKSKNHMVASRPKGFLQDVASLRIGSGVVSQAALFLLKMAALETVRRFSRAKCPWAWRGFQALQFLCYPPFKWFQRFAPFKALVNGMQVVSKPLLVLSIATVFTDEAEFFNRTSDGINNSDACSEVQSEVLSEGINDSTLDTRVPDQFPQNVEPEMWLVELHEELERQGISLPERIDEEELRRFYTAANGDFSRLLSSVKKTIHWRETYGILSIQELEMWSNMVFWHGFDVKHRPCLIVRLGLACTSLPSHDRPRFAQAIISQVEHGVYHLLDATNAQITVVVDCEGLSPLKIPMQVMRTCSSLLQDHFPNRLGCLFVIRLPPMLRVIAQTFIQVLKPYTREKLRIEGESYRKILSEYLEALPLYLGGKCQCKICTDMWHPRTNEVAKTELREDLHEGRTPLPAHPTYENEVDMEDNWDQLVRTAIFGLLMVWVFIAFLSLFFDPESRPFPFSPK